MEIRLGDYVKIKTGKLNANAQDEKGKYPFFTCAKEISRIDTYAYDCECVLVAGNGVLNAKYYNGKFNAYQRVYIIEVKNKEEISTRFLFYFIGKYMEKLRNGSIGGVIKYIKLNHLTDITLNLPDLETQNKTVELLDRAKSVLQKRKKSIDLLEKLLRMQFLEMFGDPMFNPKKYKCSTLKDVCHFITKGTTPKAKEIHKKSFEDSIPFLKVYNIKDDGTIDFKYKPSYVSKEIHSNFLKRSKVYPNDVLMNIVGPPLGKIGIVNSSFEEWNVNQAIAIFRCTDLISPIYLLNVLRSENLLNKIIRKAVGVRQLNISLDICRNIKIPIPPIELQNQFETIYHNIQAQKETLTQSKTKLEDLYNHLLQDAFKREIELKKKDSIMPEVKKKEGEKIDITNLDLATFLGIPDEITSTQEKWMFDLISLDEFYQFLLKDNFTKEETFTLQDIEEKLHNFFYQGGEIDFPNTNWQQIIFKFLEAKPPLLEQIFEEETATVKLKLTDETFKA